MRTARSLPYKVVCWGVSLTETPRTETPLDKDPPGQRPPWTETLRQRPPGQRPPGQRCPPRQRPPRDPPWSCDLWCMLGQTSPCEQNKNIGVKTLPCPKLHLWVVNI